MLSTTSPHTRAIDQTFVKKRWLGRTVLDVFVSEFKSQPQEYYERALADGRLTVCGERAAADRVLKNGEWVTHLTHRHEPPVRCPRRLEVLYNDEHKIVVAKPPTVPVHPCGAYRYNSLTVILAREHGMPELSLCHRLDRLTSGLVILAKDKETAVTMHKQFHGGDVHKSYVARVRGCFPTCAFPLVAGDEAADVGAASDRAPCAAGPCKRDEYAELVSSDAPSSESEGKAAQRVRVWAPLQVASAAAGVHEVHPDGKPAETVFTLLSSDGETSVVRCEPKTGRTHQIRLHLQWLGHPIANDPNYGGDLRFGLGADDAAVSWEASAGDSSAGAAEGPATDSSGAGGSSGTGRPAAGLEDTGGKLSERQRGALGDCQACRRGQGEFFTDGHLHSQGIYLHAQRYVVSLSAAGTAGHRFLSPHIRRAPAGSTSVRCLIGPARDSDCGGTSWLACDVIA